jgi:aquaporin Z
MIQALTHHWPQYLVEALLLGAFMVSACLGAFALEHPASPVSMRITSPFVRRVLMGALMGLTAIALIYSSLGAMSGAHMNPAITLTFLVLGKVEAWDALFYIAAQCAGGVAGVRVAGVILGPAIRHGAVNYVVTAPGRHGRAAAWLAEFAIAFGMMSVVLLASNEPGAAPYTGLFAGALVALFITFEAPLSGMSINPARSLASAIPACSYRGLWIYFTAPPLAMLSAGGVYTRLGGARDVYCAKINHAGESACPFDCRIHRMRAERPRPTTGAGIEPAGPPDAAD